MKIRHLFVSLLVIAGLSAGCEEPCPDCFILSDETTEALCSDGVDNNINGLVDCKEESCKQFAHCKDEPADLKEICDNQLDDDGDNKADCDDEDCASVAPCQPVVKLEICDNQLDDDDDHKADCDDEDCASAAHCQPGETKTEICDNKLDDDGDNKADCDDEDCASAALCQPGETKIEICDNLLDDDGDHKADCDDEDCASAAHCQKSICDNELDDDNDERIDCDDPDCASVANCAPKELKNLLYKVGLISDIHNDRSDKHHTEHAQDIKNAVEYFMNNNVSFIASCGDYAESAKEDIYVGDNHVPQEDGSVNTGSFFYYYHEYAWLPSNRKLNLLSAIGHHDYQQMLNITNGEAKDVWINYLKRGFDHYTGSGYKNMYYFEYDGVWNQYVGGAGKRTGQSKLSYWVQTSDENHKTDKDIYVFLSLDYGDPPVNKNYMVMSKAVNLLDMNNKYVKQMKDYVADTDYDETKEMKFNYQFYHPNTLIWLKDIIENNQDKHIFVFTHLYITHKAGNGVPFSGKYYHSSRRIWPDTADPQMLEKFFSGANALSGLEFHFINKLNNKYKNVIWFSGHTHYSWESEKIDSCLNFCNKEFEYYHPTGNDALPASDNFGSLIDNKLYARMNNKPKGLSAWNVHIPSLSKPLDLETDTDLFKASQGGIMEVYENGVRIKGLSFKKEGASSYENQVVVTKDIFFP